jgi:stage V sporulation protein B
MDESVELRIASGTLMLGASQIMAIALGVVFSVIVARLLGPESYGLVGISLTYPTLIASLLDLGLGSAIARYVAMPGEDRRLYTWTGTLAKLLFGALGAIIVYACADFFAYLLARPYITQLVKVLSIYVAATCVLGGVQSAFSGLGKYSLAGSIAVSQYALRGPLTVALILAGLGSYGAVASFSIAYAVLGVVYSLLFIKLFKKPKFSKKALKKMLTLSIPLYTAGLVQLVVGPAINTVLAQYTTDVELGNYSVAISSLAPINAVVVSISTAALTSLPILIGDSNILQKKTMQVAIYSSIILIATVLGYISILTPLVYLLYGVEYKSAPIYAIAYAAGIAVNAILTGGILGSFFITVGSTKWNCLLGMFSSTSTILSALILIPTCSALGAAIAHSIGSTVSGAAAYIIARRNFSINISLKDCLRGLMPAAIASTAAHIVMCLLGCNIITALIVAGVAYIAIYLAILPLTVNKKDIRNVIELTSKLAYIGKIIKPLGKTYLGLVKA